MADLQIQVTPVDEDLAWFGVARAGASSNYGRAHQTANADFGRRMKPVLENLLTEFRGLLYMPSDDRRRRAYRRIFERLKIPSKDCPSGAVLVGDLSLYERACNADLLQPGSNVRQFTAAPWKALQPTLDRLRRLRSDEEAYWRDLPDERPPPAAPAEMAVVARQQLFRLRTGAAHDIVVVQPPLWVRRAASERWTQVVQTTASKMLEKLNANGRLTVRYALSSNQGKKQRDAANLLLRIGAAHVVAKRQVGLEQVVTLAPGAEVREPARTAAFNRAATKKLEALAKQLELDLTGMPSWMREDHAARAWLAAAIKENAKHERLQSLVSSLFKAFEKLEGYKRRGDKLGVNWSRLGADYLFSPERVVDQVRASKGPREFLADIEKLSDRVTKVKSADAAAILHGAKKSTKESGDYGWCTGWFWTSHFDDYNEDGDIYLVRTGPVSHKVKIGDVEVGMADKKSRGIFNVHIDENGGGEIRAPGNAEISIDEFKRVVKLLEEAGVDTSDFEQSAEEGAIDGLDNSVTQTVYAIYTSLSSEEGLDNPDQVFEDHKEAEDAATEVSKTSPVWLFELEIPRVPEGQSIPEFELDLQDHRLVRFESGPATYFIQLKDGQEEGPFDSEEDAEKRLNEDENLRAALFEKGGIIAAVKAKQSGKTSKNAATIFTKRQEGALNLIGIGDYTYVVDPEGRTQRMSDVDAMTYAAAWIMRNPKGKVFAFGNDETAEYKARGRNVTSPYPAYGQWSFPEFPVQDRPADGPTAGDYMLVKVPGKGYEIEDALTGEVVDTVGTQTAPSAYFRKNYPGKRLFDSDSFKRVGAFLARRPRRLT